MGIERNEHHIVSDQFMLDALLVLPHLILTTL